MDISFDCETLGIEHDATILSIGAVRFDRHDGKIHGTRYFLIDLDSPGAEGSISASTVAWWIRQGEQARQEAFGVDLERVGAKHALESFSDFCAGCETFWQRGDKDAQWIESACKRVDVATPWKFWEVRDQRTLTAEFGHMIGAKTERVGVTHNALSDALAQAEDIIAIFHAIKQPA